VPAEVVDEVIADLKSKLTQSLREHYERRAASAFFDRVVEPVLNGQAPR
jgi:hypothetical protein